MKNLVRLTIFDKVFYATQGTEIRVEEQKVWFIPKEGGYIFFEGVKFLGGSSFYDNATREMTGRIDTPCMDVLSEDIIECRDQISLVDGEFKLAGLDADSTPITLTLMPKLDTSLVEMFIAENHDFDATLAGFLRVNPIYFDFIDQSGNEVLPSHWRTVNSYMQDAEEMEDLTLLMETSFGTHVAESVMRYIVNNK